jgi:hypothetical protein
MLSICQDAGKEAMNASDLFESWPEERKVVNF